MHGAAAPICDCTGDANDGETCASGEVCSSGQCALTCQQGLLECNGTCTDPQTSEAFCGASGPCAQNPGTVCGAGESCEGGQCTLSCAPGTLDCNGQCVDPDNDPSFCGAGPDCSQNPGTQCGAKEACVSGICMPLAAACTPPFGQASYDAATTFTEAVSLLSSRMTIAFDGTNRWSSSGGSSSGIRLASHQADGTVLSYYEPGIDMRSVFTKRDATSPVFARGFGSAQVRVQTSPGVFGNDVSLTGGTLDGQSAVVWDDANDEFVAHINGNVTRWDASGGLVGSVALSGYGSQNGEGAYPADRGVAWACGHYLTYSNGVLSAWDAAGTRVATTTLTSAGSSFDSHFSYSYAQGLFYVVDDAGGSWRGYEVF